MLVQWKVSGLLGLNKKRIFGFFFWGGAKGKSIKDLYFMIVYEPKGDVCSSCPTVWYTVTSVCTENSPETFDFGTGIFRHLLKNVHLKQRHKKKR